MSAGTSPRARSKEPSAACGRLVCAPQFARSASTDFESVPQGDGFSREETPLKS